MECVVFYGFLPEDNRLGLFLLDQLLASTHKDLFDNSLNDLELVICFFVFDVLYEVDRFIHFIRLIGYDLPRK